MTKGTGLKAVASYFRRHAKRTSRGLKALLLGGNERLWLGSGYALAFILTLFIIWLTIAEPGTGPIGPASRYLFILVCFNFILLLGLSAFVIRRVHKIWQSRVDGAGARLHLRFVTLFSLAAVAPALIVALFFGVMVNRGVETWFSDRVQASVNNGAFIAKTYLGEQFSVANLTMAQLAADIEQDQAQSLFSDRLGFSMGLRDLLVLRGNLSAVYLIDGTGQILARAEMEDAPPFMAPPPATIEKVSSEGVGRGDLGRVPDSVRILYPLQHYNGAMLYGVRMLPKGMVARFDTADKAINDLREVNANSLRVQGVFAMTYIETVMLVLVAAIWIGTSFADSIAAPVADLVQAADRVAGGDLNARVATKSQSKELLVLSKAFNRMTSDLQSQQAALKSAGEEAESRRRFIETVLSEISAGIIGVDKLEHISALNRHAAQFLGVAADVAIGQNLRLLAPEVADLLDVVSINRVEEQEVDLIRKGETRRVRVRASGLETGGAVLTFDDITRLVAAQRNAAWKDVARRIAHEIKNPLTPIQLSAERLQKKYRQQIQTDKETFDRCTDTIIRQVGDIGRMVDEFSAFARMPLPNFASEDIAEILRQTCFSQRVAAPEIYVELIEPLEPTIVFCDGRMLAQAIGNVLKNGGEAIMARRFRDYQNQGEGSGDQGQNTIGANSGTDNEEDDALSQKYKGHLRVSLHMKHDQSTSQMVVIEIEDNGIGLPAKDRDRLTEPYVTTREKGTGLGLAIVKRIIEDHGGDFYLEDAQILDGAKAIINLPHQQSLTDKTKTNSIFNQSESAL